MKKKVCALLCLFSPFVLPAQLTGTLNLPSLTYTSLASVMSDLNLQGTTGTVVVNVSAGYTETSVSGGYTLYATGTLTSPIIFRKNGIGNNPRIYSYANGTRTPGSAIQDGIWRFVGCDYITVDGIDLIDINNSNPATMEFGFGFFKSGASDGCQHNTVKNCGVTLSRLNNAAGAAPAADGSRGIDIVNTLPSLHNASITVTSPSGSNSYNSFYNNTIRDCNIGISAWGFNDLSPFSNCDTGNEIGGAISGSGNSILNFGGGGYQNAACGIRTAYQQGLMIGNNLLNNNDGSGADHTTTLRAIQINASPGANVAVTGNTLSIHGGGTTSQITVIENAAGSGAVNNTVTISGNLIRDCSYLTASSGSYYGIYNSGSASYLDISNNRFSNNSTGAASGSTYLIYNTAPIGSLIAISGNSLSLVYNGASSYTGVMHNIYNTAAGPSATMTINNNRFVHYAHLSFPASGTFYFINNTADLQVLDISKNVWKDLSMNHSGAEYFISNASSTQSLLSVVANTVTNHQRLAATGNMYGYYGASSSPGTCIQTFSSNVFSEITSTVAGTGNFYGIYNTEGNSAPYPRKIVAENLFTNINLSTSGNCYGLYLTDLGDAGSSAGSAIYGNTVSALTSDDVIYGLYTAGPASSVYPVQVRSNVIRSLTSSGNSSSLYGAWLGGSNAGITFTRNRISDVISSGTAASVFGLYGATTGTSTIVNNIIGNIFAPQTSGANRINGIYISGGTVSMYYNSVNLSGTSLNAGSNALYAVTASSVTLRNNIFNNLCVTGGTSYAAAYRRSGTSLTGYLSASNNNLFYAGTGTNSAIFHNGTAYTTLPAFQAFVAPRESLSISQAQNFINLNGASFYFLHLPPSITSMAESAAVNIIGVSDDHDIQIRAGNSGYAGTGTAPDIGADEVETNTLACNSVSAALMLSSSLTVCAGKTVALLCAENNSGSGISRQWKVATSPGGPFQNVTGGSGNQTNEYFTATLSAGTFYYVLETTCANVTGTIISSQATLTVKSVPVAAAMVTASMVCAGDTIKLQAQPSAALYVWKGPGGYYSDEKDPVRPAVTAAAGSYTLSVTANGCVSAPQFVTVQVSSVLFLPIRTRDNLCSGASATLSLYNPATSYTWSGGSGSPSLVVTPSVSTVYSVAATSSNNCTAKFFVPVNVISPTITSGNFVSCNSAGISTLSVNAFSPSLIHWYASATSTIPLYSGNTFTVSSASGNTFYASAVSANNATLQTPLNGGAVSAGNMFDIVAFTALDLQSAEISFNTTGSYTVAIWYRYGSYVGNTTSSSGWIPVGAATVNATAGQMSFIPLSFAVPVTAGQSCALYIASNGSLNHSNSTNTLAAINTDMMLLTGASGGAFSVTSGQSAFNGRIAYSKPGCASPLIPVVLTVSSPPVIVASVSPPTVCPGSICVLTASGATTFSWTGLGSGATKTINVQSPTVYSVTATGSVGCKSATQVTVFTHTAPLVSASQSQFSVCPSWPVTFTATGATSYTWNTGAIGPVNTVFPPVNSTYTVWGSNGQGCQATNTVAVSTKSVPVIIISQSHFTLCAGTTVTLGAKGAASYTWMPGNVTANSFTAAPSVSSVYNAIGTSVNGCTNVAFAYVETGECVGIYEEVSTLPVSFSPNPTSGPFLVKFKNCELKTIRVLNSQGLEILSYNSDRSLEGIDLSIEARGIYFLLITGSGLAWSGKLIVE